MLSRMAEWGTPSSWSRLCAPVRTPTLRQGSSCVLVINGRCWTRTSDPIDVNDVLYQAELSGRPFGPFRATFQLNRPGQGDPADQYPQGESNPRLLAENQLS